MSEPESAPAPDADPDSEPGAPDAAALPGSAVAPSLADFEAMAEAAAASLPPWVLEAAGPFLLRIEDFAPDEILDEMGIEDPYALTGLYDGVALTDRSELDPPGPPGEIRLFRRAILEEWIDRGDVSLQALVGHILVHELAHHFGWSDARIARIDAWWE